MQSPADRRGSLQTEAENLGVMYRLRAWENGASLDLAEDTWMTGLDLQEEQRSHFLSFPIPTSEKFSCHVCELENSFNCTNPTECPSDKQFCVMAAIRKCYFLLGAS